MLIYHSKGLIMPLPSFTNLSSQVFFTEWTLDPVCGGSFSPLSVPVVLSRWELAAMTTNSSISRPIFSSHGWHRLNVKQNQDCVSGLLSFYLSNHLSSDGLFFVEFESVWDEFPTFSKWKTLDWPNYSAWGTFDTVSGQGIFWTFERLVRCDRNSWHLFLSSF